MAKPLIYKIINRVCDYSTHVLLIVLPACTYRRVFIFISDKPIITTALFLCDFKTELSNCINV